MLSRVAMAMLLSLPLNVACRDARADWPALDTPAPVVGGGAHDVALVVGIEDYAVLEDVQGASANARDWYQWFLRGRGIRPDRVKLLTDSAGTTTAIRDAAAELAAKVGSRGTFWIVFIGHGAPAKDQSEGVLATWAAQQAETNFYPASLRQSELAAAATGRQAHTVFIMDTCFSGKSSQGSVLIPGLQATLLVNRNPAPSTDSGIWLYAANGAQFAGPLPGARLPRPAFSYLILGALRGWADAAPWGDGDGRVTAREATDYAAAALSSFPALGREQTPQLVGREDLVLVNDAREPGPDLSELALAEAARRGNPYRLPEVNTPTTAPASVVKLDVAAARAAEAREKQRIHALRNQLVADWSTINELLSMSTVSAADKQSQLEAFLAQYAELSRDVAYISARTALTRLAHDGLISSPRATAELAKSAPRGYVLIPAGSFTMGESERSKFDPDASKAPPRVTITRPFYMQAREMTQGEYEGLMGVNPSRFKACGPTCPVEYVSWKDAVRFANVLSSREGLPSCYDATWNFVGLSCLGYRLPTEAEWEYAARAGVSGTPSQKKPVAPWTMRNSKDSTHPVGGLPPNDWGLYDILGNVWEWTQDTDGIPHTTDVRDPVRHTSYLPRVMRGGSWFDPEHYWPTAYRKTSGDDSRYIYVGFRLVRSIR